MSRLTTSDPWLATVVAEAAERGFEDPGETIEPERARTTDARALFGTHAADGDGELIILDTLATGGMGVIRLARQTSLGREVAVKSLRDSTRRPEYAAELLREAWVTGAVEHPNVVPVHDIASDEEGMPQVVMKRIAGRSWSELLDDPGRAPPGDLDQLRGDIEILVQVINAIRFAHDKRIVHRDLKPANVMVGEFGEVYVVDWGLAVSIDDAPDGDLGRFAHARDAAGTLAGTPAYMAPEMLGDDESALVDERTDVYLLGAVLYELMTGRVVHRGRGLLEALEHVRSGEPSFPPGLPGELVRICRKALARDPADRHPSAAALLADLRSFLAHLSSSRLAAEAEQSLAELGALIEAGADRERVYHRFGECRFGFRAALATWADNPVARRGLDRAIVSMVELELAGGDGSTALALLAEHPDPPAHLAERAESLAAERRERDERLARMEADTDPWIGRGARVASAVGISALWVLLPLLFRWLDFESSTAPDAFWRGALILLIGWCALFAAFGLAMNRLFKNRFNRLIFWGVFAGGPPTALVMLGGLALELPVETAPVLALLVWTAGAAVLTVTLDRRVAIGALIYGAAFAAAAFEPRWRYEITAVANLAAGVAAVWLWGGLSETRAPPDRSAT